MLDQLKFYLAFLPQILSPGNAKELLVYLHVFDHALSVVLVKEEGRNQMLVYYVSRLLQIIENYIRQEKLVLALIMAARTLR